MQWWTLEGNQIGMREKQIYQMANPHSIYVLLGMTHLLSSSILVPRLWVKYHLQWHTSVALKVPLIYVPMYNMCARSPKVNMRLMWYHKTMKPWFQTLITLESSRFKDLYTPICGNIEDSFSFMPYWNLGCLQKMI